MSHCLHFLQTTLAHLVPGKRLHHDGARGHEIYQTSVMSAVMDGLYEGSVTIGELARHGDFGVGTFNALDGEMVALDGQFYRLTDTGEVTRAGADQLTPFAAVTHFRPEIERRIEDARSRTAIEQLIGSLEPNRNLFYPLRIDGRFAHVRVRCVPKQHKPYPAFSEVAKTQTTHDFNDVSGSLVGFRSPDYTQGIAVAGYHLHFIDDARSCGGHVLDFTLTRGMLRIDRTSELHVELPDTAAFAQADLHGADSAAIAAAES